MFSLPFVMGFILIAWRIKIPFNDAMPLVNNSFSFGLIILFILVGIVVYWFKFQLKESGKKERRERIHSVVCIFFAVMLGFSIFFMERGSSDYFHRQAVKDSLVEELIIIIHTLFSNCLLLYTFTLTSTSVILRNGRENTKNCINTNT